MIIITNILFRHLMEELITTEEAYIKDLEHVCKVNKKGNHCNTTVLHLITHTHTLK